VWTIQDWPWHTDCRWKYISAYGYTSFRICILGQTDIDVEFICYGYRLHIPVQSCTNVRMHVEHTHLHTFLCAVGLHVYVYIYILYMYVISCHTLTPIYWTWPRIERERVDLLFISILDYLSVPVVLLTFWCGIGRTEQTNQMNIPTETNLLVNWCLDLLRMVLKNPESNAWNLGRTSI
jgi:hypothetical protein